LSGGGDGGHRAGLLRGIGEENDARAFIPRWKASVLIGFLGLAYWDIDRTRDASSREFPRAARIDKDRRPVKPQSITEAR
jgi:hypothetical protein